MSGTSDLERQAAADREKEAAREALAAMMTAPETVDLGTSDAGTLQPKLTGSRAVSESELRGDPHLYPLPNGGPVLHFRPLTRKKLRVFESLVWQWPFIIRAASLSIPPGANSGIDAEATAVVVNAYMLARWRDQQNAAQEAAAAGGGDAAATLLSTDPPAPCQAADIPDMVASLTDPDADADIPRIWDFDALMLQTVWLCAEGTPGIAWPRPGPTEAEGEAVAPAGCQWLDDVLDEHLTVPDMAALLAALKRSQGSFKGCMFRSA